MPGPWTVIEEYLGIDVLAFSAWSRPPGTPTGSPSYPIVGYEVKVGRGDYRKELLRPHKRAKAVARCHAFYFAVPKGLLTKDELAYVEPEHFEGQAFVREPCPAECHKRATYTSNGRRRLRERLSGHEVEVPTAYGEVAMRKRYDGEVEEFDPTDRPWQAGRAPRRWVVCEVCEGRGYLRQSVVEEEAPTLWVPRDVGLVECTTDRARVVRKAPINDEPARDWAIANLVRWVSMRPDPRHHERAVEAAA